MDQDGMDQDGMDQDGMEWMELTGVDRRGWIRLEEGGSGSGWIRMEENGMD